MKKSAVLWIFLAVLFMAACGKDVPVDTPQEQESLINEDYAALEQAVSAFNALSSGTMQIQIDYMQKHAEANGQGGSVYQSLDKHTISFVKAGQNYNFIKIVEAQEQTVPMGYKQQDGVYTTYNYEAYGDGTFQWKEGAAELEYYELPAESSVFTDLTDISLIDDILREKEGDIIKYSFVLDEAFYDYAVRESEFNNYELREYNINYFVDQNNVLSRVSLIKDEFWVQSENYNVEQKTVYEISLLEKNQPVDLNYFKNSSTYTKPVYNEITEIWREDFINIPETYILDVRVPRVKESLPNAYKINQRIEEDCAVALNATVEDLVSEGEWGGYPWHTVDFAVYRFDDVYQLCIFNTEASAWGSGIGMWMYKYYYDTTSEDIVSPEDFLESMNYTQEDILQIFYEDYLGEIDMGDYTYEEIADWYYFGEDGSIQFYVNLFG